MFTEGTCKLLNLVISDLVDEDCVLHRRKQAVSALVFGTASLLSKPGQTIAPLLGTTLLAIQTGQLKTITHSVIHRRARVQLFQVNLSGMRVASASVDSSPWSFCSTLV